MNGGKIAPGCSPDGTIGMAPSTTATTAPENAPAPATTKKAREEGHRKGRRQGWQGQEEYGQRFTADVGYVDVDTRVSRESYGAARMAAGAVILAVSRGIELL